MKLLQQLHLPVSCAEFSQAVCHNSPQQKPTPAGMGNDALPVPTRHVQLPPELIEAIVELLHDDWGALQTCALLSKAWVPASRHHLFSQIRIYRVNSLAASELLSSAKSTINSAVKRLALNTIHAPSVLEVLDGIAYRLPNVTELSLRGSHPYELSVFPPPSLIPLLWNLESLRLIYVSFDPAGASLLSLLHHCPQLRTLSCYEVSLYTPVDAGTERSPQPLPIDHGGLVSSLQSLQVYLSPTVLPWIVERWMSAMPCLTTLDLYFYSWWEIGDAAEKLLEAVGSELRNLRLCYYLRNLRQSLSTYSSGARVPHTHHFLFIVPMRTASILSRFTFLTQLRSFSFDFGEWRGNQNDCIRFMVQAMRYLTSPHLGELTITLPSWVKLGALDSDVWTELSLLIESPQFFHTLQTIIIRFAGRESLDSREVQTRKQWVEERFPLCAARGIVRVETATHVV
jgi:hypothetical protein